MARQVVTGCVGLGLIAISTVIDSLTSLLRPVDVRPRSVWAPV